MVEKVVASNRRAGYEYFIIERFEAGIALFGTEIKSVRAGQMSLAEAFVEIKDKSAWLVNAHIATYNPASRNNHDPKRPRRLLLHKSEIRDLWDAVRLKGTTIIPLRVYIKDGIAKVEIAIAKGKKLYDKRATIAARDEEREASRQRHSNN